MRVAALLLFLIGCDTPSPRPAQESLSEAARALRPAVPGGEKSILDALEFRARDTLNRISHPTDRASWEKAVPQLRRRLRDALGLDLLPRPAAKNVRSVGKVERSGYRIEKLVFETLPGTDAPAHLYLPSGAVEKGPAILFVPGHWYADSKTRPEFQAFAIAMARKGFIVLTYDPFGQGERGISTRDHRRTELLAAGIAQQAIVDFESLCALEILLARPEVDPTRVGMTGASGGGFNSWIVPALDSRIAVTVSVVGTGEFYEQLSAVRGVDWFTAKEHCHYIPGLLRFANNHEFLAMVAPRPVMVISAHNDIGFPIPGNRAVVEYGRTLYAALGEPARVAYFEDANEGHGYQKKKREAAYGWFLKWLKHEGDGSPVAEPELEIPPYDSPELRCFPPGENRPAGPGIVAAAKATLEKQIGRDIPSDPGAFVAGTLGLPYPLPVAPAPDLVTVEARLEMGRPERPRRVGAFEMERVRWRSPDGVEVPAVRVGPPGEWKGAILACSDGGKEDLLEHPALRAALDGGWAVIAADPRGLGELSVTKPGWAFATSLLLGENWVGRQAIDLVGGSRALRSHPKLRGKPIALLGSGRFAALAALYAGVLEREVKWVVCEKGFGSFRAFVYRPRSEKASFALARPGAERDVVLDREIPHALIPAGVLFRFDMVDLVEAMAPRPVLIAEAIDGDFEPVAGNPGPAAVLEFVRLRISGP